MFTKVLIGAESYLATIPKVDCEAFGLFLRSSIQTWPRE